MELRLRREKKERREALVREALESLSVGPLLRTSVDKVSFFFLFKCSYAMYL